MAVTCHQGAHGGTGDATRGRVAERRLWARPDRGRVTREDGRRLPVGLRSPAVGCRSGNHRHADVVSAHPCLLYTSDAADERSSVDLGGRRIIKKKTNVDHIVCERHIRRMRAKHQGQHVRQLTTYSPQR